LQNTLPFATAGQPILGEDIYIITESARNK